MPKAKTKTKKGIFRQYKDGETVVIMPFEKADPAGDMAVAFTNATGFMAVDPKVVFKNTVPAVGMGKKRLQRDLERGHALVFEELATIPKEAETERKAKEERWPDLVL